MAAAGRSWPPYFLVLYTFITLSSVFVSGVEEIVGLCGTTIDFLENNKYSAIVSMSLPSSMSDYQNPRNKLYCDVTIRFSAGMNLMIELYYLDIIPDKDSSGTCTTGLEVLDQTSRNVYGKRLCMEAWEWEELHAMSKQEKKIVQTSPLILRLESEGPYRGNGFKVHINLFRPQYPCLNREFKCKEFTRCVNDDLRCDSWNDCGDHSDEEREAGCGLLTASEICAIVLGCLFFLGQVIIFALFCYTYRRLRRDYGLRSESKIPLGMDPELYKRYNSQESMGTHYSRTTGGGRTRRDSDSSVDKMDLEKIDRFITDNGSERSYRSNAKSKARSLALGSDTASETPRKTGQYSYNGGRRGRVASSNSINKGEAPLKINGIDNLVINQDSPRDSVERNGGRTTPDRKSTGSRKRNRGRDDYSDYSDEEEERRRRRRSRDRRSYRYSDDYDSESDYDRERRRRRRRGRSYSDDDYDSYDSEYERERRRQRSKERQRRSRELDGENQDKEGQDNSESKGGPRRRRNRTRDSYDSEEEDGKSRRQRRSPSYNSRDRRRRQRSRSYDDDEKEDEDRDRRRRRRSPSYDDDYERDRSRRRSPSYDDDDDSERDRKRRRRRSNDRRRNQNEERSSRPPSSERDETDARKDAERMSRALAKEVESKVPKHDVYSESPQPPLPSSFRPLTPKEETPPPPLKAKEDMHSPPPSQKRALTPPQVRNPSPSPAVSIKQPSNHSYHPPAPQPKHQRLPPISPPPSGEEIRQMEEEREKKKQQLHQQRIQRHQQGPSPPSSISGAPVSPDVDNRERRRSQDNRRERYSRDRFRQKGRRSDPEPPTSPPDYEDVNPRVRLDAPLAGYREETV
ncbi:hypothetical protein RRG08_018696 [Elysia crispata]|uniref:CUB domain-containing protein n=1 Tax=Elysia crispata TaxID=231223 RepID=A0AAE0YHV6_9GAST|nr:hypothetical protein RRG08_018696 [Elysia crispata]